MNTYLHRFKLAKSRNCYGLDRGRCARGIQDAVNAACTELASRGVTITWPILRDLTTQVETRFFTKLAARVMS